jgi:hypothetical protein
VAFLEYKENGEPYPFVQDSEKDDEPDFADFLKRLIREGNANPAIDNSMC